MKNSQFLIYALVAIGFILLFSGYFFTNSAYDLQLGTTDECGNIIATITELNTRDTTTSPFITGPNYASLYTSCVINGCIKKDALVATPLVQLTHSFGPYTFTAKPLRTLNSEGKCVWAGTLQYNGRVIKTFTASEYYRGKYYLRNDGTEDSVNYDYILGMNGYSSDTRCVESNFYVTYTNPICTTAGTISTLGSNRVTCEYNNPPLEADLYNRIMSFDVVFIKSGNTLPCLPPARQDPVTRRSEPLVLIDEQGNSLGELEGYVVTLQPGEVKTLRMRTSVARLVNNESYAIQVSARAAGDEGEAANDYEWYKE